MLIIPDNDRILSGPSISRSNKNKSAVVRLLLPNRPLILNFIRAF